MDKYILKKNLTTSYYQMAILPYALSPTGRGSLGYFQKEYLEQIYPPLRFNIGPVPISCPPCGVRIYQTGNAQNPNIYTEFDPY